MVILALVAASTSASASPELAIYPGFEKAELAQSARAVLQGATACAAYRKVHEDSGPTPTRSPHVSASEIDGQPVSTWSRVVEFRCPTAPVWRCLVSSVWDPATEEVGYASIQCFGSHNERYTSFLVTATRDLVKGHQEGRVGTPKDKGVRRWSITFQTDDFPGTHLAATAGTRRKDGVVVEPPHLARFDDFDTTDEDEVSPVDAPTVEAVVRETQEVACRLTGGCRAPELHTAGP